jgi:hypothetical protein
MAMDKASKSWWQEGGFQNIISCLLIHSNVKELVNIFAITDFSLSSLALVDCQISLNPNLTINNVSNQLYRVW